MSIHSKVLTAILGLSFLAVSFGYASGARDRFRSAENVMKEAKERLASEEAKTEQLREALERYKPADRNTVSKEEGDIRKKKISFLYDIAAVQDDFRLKVSTDFGNSGSDGNEEYTPVIDGSDFVYQDGSFTVEFKDYAKMKAFFDFIVGEYGVSVLEFNIRGGGESGSEAPGGGSVDGRLRIYGSVPAGAVVSGVDTEEPANALSEASAVRP